MGFFFTNFIRGNRATGGGIPRQTDLISHLLHSNGQAAASNKATWSYVSIKDANRPYEHTGAIEEIFEHVCI